ncbi:hypothetical protein SAMN04488047_10783 [Tranquillimonas alkanivorans]|uniref:Uncharacterized protein n=1 Tax=Tranquillimonas alkanivorans TaxID=441119 RepID=A0A1I5QSH5_9RHOB|nr:hypothetical protein SAMN04488047_10783 [Tranquillimonas alkanivorans]
MIIPETPGRSALSLLEVADAQYREAVQALVEMKRHVRARRDLPEAEVKRVLQALGRSVQTAFDERKKLEDRARRERGIAEGAAYALDFDKVREEVGRSLDRLRAAGGSGEVPG